MTESAFKCRVVKLIKKELPGCWSYHPTDRWVSGVPDLLLLYRGVFAAIELKVGRNTASKIQVVVLARIEAAGGMTWICRNSATEDGFAFIRSVCLAIKTRAELLERRLATKETV